MCFHLLDSTSAKFAVPSCKLQDRTIGALQAAILIDNLDWIGWGRDQACPAQHSGLELLWAWRVEHQGLWAKYRAEQCKMRADLKVSGIQVQPVDIKESLQAATKDLAQLDAEVRLNHIQSTLDPRHVPFSLMLVLMLNGDAPLAG